MYKIYMDALVYEVKKTDGLVPTDESKLVDLSHGKLVFEKEFLTDSSEDATHKAYSAQMDFMHSHEPSEDCEFVPLFKGGVKEVKEDD